MEIEYTTDLEDVLAFNLYHLRKNPGLGARQRRSRILIVSVYGLVGLSWLYFDPGHWLMALIFLGLGGLWYRFYNRTWEERVRRQIHKSYPKIKEAKKAEEKQRLRLKADGIYVQRGGQEGLISWAQIFNLVCLDDYIYIYLNQEESIIIPRKKIVGNIIWDKLCEGLRSGLQQ